MKSPLRYFLYLTVFTTGATILIIEILGTRIIAPFYGSTIFVWSSLITVTLAALAAGYWIGGWFADRKPQFPWLFRIILTASLFLFPVIPLTRPILLFTDRFGMRAGPLLATTLLFTIPLFLLGTATPFAVRLLGSSTKKAGVTSGKVFAIGTIGSIVGSLLAGFVLIQYFSISLIFLLLATWLALIAIAGLVFSNSFKLKEVALFILLAYLSFLAGTYTQNPSPSANLQIKLRSSSFYGDLKVVEFGQVRCLLINGAPQTCIDLEKDETTFQYIAETKRIIETRPEDKHILLLGLGGGSLLSSFSPRKKIDIIEIDPKVVSLAHGFFGLKEQENLNIIIQDARSFLRQTDKKYDFVFVDVYSGEAVPAHLLTSEFFQELKQKTTGNGLVVFNIIGHVEPEDSYVASFTHTLKHVFPRVIVTSPGQGLQNLIIHASANLDYRPSLSGEFKSASISSLNGVALTDDKNAIELLALPVLEELKNNARKAGVTEVLLVR